MKPYTHVVQYYETDKMGITHHSNYIRFMEEARCDYLKQIGFSYKKMEELGVVSPTIEIDVKYKKTTTFEDKLKIFVKITEVTATKTCFSYSMQKDGEEVCSATSVHCFVTPNGRPVATKKVSEELYNLLVSKIEK